MMFYHRHRIPARLNLQKAIEHWRHSLGIEELIMNRLLFAHVELFLLVQRFWRWSCFKFPHDGEECLLCFWGTETWTYLLWYQLRCKTTNRERSVVQGCWNVCRRLVLSHKHAVTHQYCQLHCNPAQYPKLMDGGKWFFNKIIAEQTSAWLGGYHSMCQKTLPAKFDFFLDEMTCLRNIETIDRLERQGCHPHFL